MEGGDDVKVYMEVERFGGAYTETRGVEAKTEEECEEFILSTANTYGTVHVLDDAGKRVRTITPAEAAERMAQ
jgi:hypothetical protein